MTITHPEWCRNATIYQINTRHLTDEGTLRSAEAHLPRLKKLGVGILWLTPIHPIGERNRKGSLGSPYSVRDYYGVNPELGTLQDLTRFVQAAHAHGLRVILDWVANHTAWDNPLLREHPEWYSRDWKGELHSTPWRDWTDVVELDYRHEALRRYMTAALSYWLREADVDGYRCDVAGFVPLEFWTRARRELEAIKPVLLLAEWESRDLHAEAFDVSYAWSWYDAVGRVARGEAADLAGVSAYYSGSQRFYPRDAMRLTFVSNHDKNAWEGTEFERFGEGLEPAIVLAMVGEGMPLVYNGQEAGNPRRLRFFDRDPIAWREHPIGRLYRTLIALKARNSALWNGAWGAAMIPVPNSAPQRVLSFVRRDERNKVLAVLNFSGEPQTVTFGETLYHGRYTALFGGASADLDASARLELKPWGYQVFIQ